MVVHPAIWRRSAAGSMPCLKHQKSSKAFVRHVDKAGNPYYRLSKNKQQQVPKAISSQDLFKISNLLLDLDAEGSRGVRSLGSRDEEQLSALWAIGPGRRAARTRVEEFKDQISDVRQKTAEIRSQQINPWRISPHDILATALHGAARSRPQDELPSAAEGIPRHTQSDSLFQLQSNAQGLRYMNGIPVNACADDESLLKWMMVRRQGLLEPTPTSRTATPSIKSFSEALKKVTSLAGLRRLIFQSLDAGFNANLFGDTPLGRSIELTQELRLVCQETLIGEQGQDVKLRLEALELIGNLSARLASQGIVLGAPLHGLGLVLSAEAGATEATFRYLHDGFPHRIWTEWPGGSDDVLSAMKAYSSNLSLGLPHTPLDQNANLQRLLQIATGLDEDNTLAPESFRSLVGTYLEDRSISNSHALQIYLSYVAILGQLGALRTIWKEYRVSLPLISGRLARGGEATEDVAAATVWDQFLTTIQASTRIVGSRGDDGSPDMSLEDCVTLDYHGLDGRPADVGLRQDRDGEAQPRGLEVSPSTLGKTVQLPLHEWLATIRKLPKA